jgi:hypothetical protein
MPSETDKTTLKPRRLQGRKKDGGSAKGASPRRMRRSSKGEAKVTSCEVPGCDKEPDRSIAFKKAKDAMDDWKLDKGSRRLHVCKDHYKEFKKATKKDRELDKAGWMDRAGKYEPKK